jgi:hypothetical protein
MLIIPSTIFPTTATIYLVGLVIIVLVRNTWLGRGFGIELLRFLCLHRSTYSGV